VIRLTKIAASEASVNEDKTPPHSNPELSSRGADPYFFVEVLLESDEESERVVTAGRSRAAAIW